MGMGDPDVRCGPNHALLQPQLRTVGYFLGKVAVTVFGRRLGTRSTRAFRRNNRKTTVGLFVSLRSRSRSHQSTSQKQPSLCTRSARVYLPGPLPAYDRLFGSRCPLAAWLTLGHITRKSVNLVFCFFIFVSCDRQPATFTSTHTTCCWSASSG